MLSIEGDEATTDARRGPGTYRELLRTMELLKEHGVLFGYSATVTRRNWQTLLSDAFVDPLVARGAAISWHFLYMPVGGAPDVSLMPTPEQRNQIRLGIQRIRNTKAMFPVDFWGDAPWVEGCIAGKHYVHVNNEGWVEPCIFTHFATDNIADTSLAEAFNSPYFKEIRARQPFNHNLLMPCMLIDNPDQSREIMAASGARPTHDGRREPGQRLSAAANPISTRPTGCLLSIAHLLDLRPETPGGSASPLRRGNGIGAGEPCDNDPNAPRGEAEVAPEVDLVGTYREWLAKGLYCWLEWRAAKAEDRPADRRYLQAAKALYRAARDVMALPDDDPRLLVWPVSGTLATALCVSSSSKSAASSLVTASVPVGTQSTAGLLSALVRAADDAVPSRWRTRSRPKAPEWLRRAKAGGAQRHLHPGKVSVSRACSATRAATRSEVPC